MINGIRSATEVGIMRREVGVNTPPLHLLVHWTREEGNDAGLCAIHTKQRATDYEFSANRIADPEISA
ncbi:MAG TPA: hypothetical protein VF469_37575 [Kofleriaceae bacterium]